MPDTVPEHELPEQAGVSASGGEAVAEPSAEPPEEVATTEGGATAGASASTWISGKKVNALWSIAENRNSWLGIAGVGWVKLANNSDSAIVALTMLGANAKVTQGSVNYRQESDKMIHEIYVW